MTKKLKKDSIANLDFRIHPELRQKLDNYCETHLEQNTEAISNAIKNYIGFSGIPVKKADMIPANDTGKTIRLNIKIHERLKEALVLYCKKNAESQTDAITNAIKLYIGCNESFY